MEDSSDLWSRRTRFDFESISSQTDARTYHPHPGGMISTTDGCLMRRCTKVRLADNAATDKGDLMATPSPGYSITVRVEAPTDPRATARLSSIVAEYGGAITALDVAESRYDKLVVDVSCNASDVAHSEAITEAIAAMDGFRVLKVSDRTFLMHLGGKIEVNPKVA